MIRRGMQAIWLENREIDLREVPVPEAPAGEALVRVCLAGICATDLELIKGYYPYTGVLGHEFVGEVVEALERPDLVGRRVVGEINAACGECEACRREDRTHCENRTVLGIKERDGAFAEYLILPFENLHVVPSPISNETAVFTEPLAAALEILTQVQISEKDRVLLVGAGRLGQLIARVLAATKCELSVSARHATQRALLDMLGIATITPEEIRAGGYDIVVEATGSQGGFADARRAVRPRGTIVLKSTYAGSIDVDFSAIVVDEITLVGSRCGPFETALEWLAEGRVDPLPLVSARRPLRDGPAALEEAGRPGVLKVLLDVGDLPVSSRGEAGGR